MEKLYLEASLEAQEENGAPKFEMIANTGARMRHKDGEYVVNMAGEIVAQQTPLPILMGHDASDPIGQATSFEVKDGKLVLTGVISFAESSDSARRFLESSRNGFPWQASIGYYPVEVRDEKEVEVNGRIEKNVKVVDKCLVCEASVVLWGADSQTHTVVKGEAMEEEKKDFDVDAVRLERAEENARLDAIEKIAKEYGDRQFVEKAILDGWTAQQFELETLRASRATAPAVHTANVEVNEEALEIAAIRASGMEPTKKRYGDAALRAADKLGNLGLQEFCELASGAKLPRIRSLGDVAPWLEAAFSTQKLNYVLERSFNAVLLETFWSAENQWRKVFKIGRVSDFKTYERYRLNPDNFKFEKRADGGKYKHAELSDARYSIKVEEFGKMYAITRVDIINDDMGVFSQLANMIAFGAAETLNEKCWSLLMNPAAVDGTAFYHADHGNLLTGKPLSLENLSAARSAFLQQKVVGDTPLGIEPKRLVVPRALEDKALMLTKATTLNNGATDYTGANYNPQNNRWEVVVSDYLQNSNYTGYSDSNWYLFADPNRLAAFEIAFLNGRDAPTIKRADADFDTEGIQIKGNIDFGLSQQDYRAALKVSST
ncbi:MAG: Mu-like prophage major head subunit gpT family protein [Thermoguttaceae bacterium]|nr:Mu-like prophage major head subunit gpT family protein [Thermoguttaceae bacterium]